MQDEFDADLYYLLALAGVIDFELFFPKFISQFSRPKKIQERHLFMEGEIHFRELSNLMNLVFKAKIDLPREFKQKLFGLTDYYDWVLDMDVFDYKKFQPIWILQYATRHYLEKAFSITQVKQSVRSYLRFNHQPKLAYYYSQYVK
ncbi:MAG: hypothetical protein EOP04_18900 [Proteobacteria bacterium]|nr:MAG: hypothetical protein EOP04_18900 [Pseudomonadota bacterium]